MEKPTFVYATHIQTTPEKLWEALTRPEFTEQYWGGYRIQSDWTVGAPLLLTRGDDAKATRGEVLQVEPPRLLSYTFICRPCDGSSSVEETTRVTFEITMEFGVTKLKITHDSFEAGSKMFGLISQGWPAILSSLKTLLETGKALPFVWKG